MLGLAWLAVFACSQNAVAQNGLENIIVEKYYVSNAADATGSIGVLPAGSVTYRIYADMLPGYKFQAAYGVPTHALTFSTTTTFFNNEDRGATTPTYSKTQARNNSVMLDSWLSVGAACVNNFGILKSEDSVATGGATVVNNTVPAILQNADPSAGIPLTVQDGLYAGTPEAVTFVGLANVANGDLSVLDATSQAGNLFTTSNGSWASLLGSLGPIPATNRVLIAQITTNGVFHYELNLQIGIPGGGVQNFVAQNPVGAEITIPSLIGTLGAGNILPTVSITAPAGGTNYSTGAVVSIAANAGDSDGSIDSVEFFVDGVKIGTDVSSSYGFNWTSTAGTHLLTARATDNSLGQTTSAAVSINVSNNIPPTISITSPAGGTHFTFPAPVPINVNAGDADGTIDSVVFFVNGTRIGADTSSAYSFSWASVIGTANLTAKAYDNQGASTTSAVVSITIDDPNALPYKVKTASNPCYQNSFCLTLEAVDSVNNVIGYDLTMQYNKLKVQPTGVIQVNSALINPNYTSTASSVDTATGLINISVYFNPSAPANANFKGKGNLLCVEFVKTANFLSDDTSSFSVPFLQESYFIGVASKSVDAGSYISYRDPSFNASLRFWYDNSPVKYNSGNPSQYLVTNIYGTDGTCANQSTAAVQPDMLGDFSYSLLNGVDVSIQKDIPGTTSVQPVVNGFDALLTRKVVLGDISFIPNVFQMIAMDVNTDGVISAGDISQINQRAVLLIPEFKQAWNYNSSGVSNGQLSKDWLFIDATTLSTDLGYRISSTYPLNDGIGFSKSRVPVIPFCLPIPILSGGICQQTSGETYKGVLIGDVNGNYATIGASGSFRTSTSDKIVFDLSKAVTTDEYVDVPVSISSNQAVYSLDFALQFNESNITFNSVIDQTGYLEELSSFNITDRTLRFTSNSIQDYDKNKSMIALRFTSKSGKISETDLLSVEGYLNGELTRVEMRSSNLNVHDISIYPNPASGSINVEADVDARLQLSDMDGRQVIPEQNVNANQRNEINIQNVSDGIYMMKIYNNNFVSVKKVVVTSLNK